MAHKALTEEIRSQYMIMRILQNAGYNVPEKTKKQVRALIKRLPEDTLANPMTTDRIIGMSDDGETFWRMGVLDVHPAASKARAEEAFDKYYYKRRRYSDYDCTGDRLTYNYFLFRRWNMWWYASYEVIDN